MTSHAAEPESPSLPVVWRPRLGRLVPHGLIPVVVACLVAVGLVMAPQVGPEDMALFGVIGAAVLAALYLVGRPRLAASDDGLLVINPLRQRRLEWAEVIGVDMAEGEPWPTLDLADGTTMVAMGIQSSDGQRATRALMALRSLVDAHGNTDART